VAQTHLPSRSIKLPIACAQKRKKVTLEEGQSFSIWKSPWSKSNAVETAANRPCRPDPNISICGLCVIAFGAPLKDSVLESSRRGYGAYWEMWRVGFTAETGGSLRRETTKGRANASEECSNLSAFWERSFARRAFRVGSRANPELPSPEEHG